MVTEDEPRPPVELVAIAGRLRPASSFLAVPQTCPAHRAAADTHGQQRSLPMPDELRQQPKEGSPRVLPKLAMLRSRTAQAVVRPSEVDDR